jgi:hypothetical protein
MAAAKNIQSLLRVIFPKVRGNDVGTSSTSTFNPSGVGQALAAPNYREHTVDLFTSRLQNDSRLLLRDLFQHDPDMSAAVNSFLTVADTPMKIIVRDFNDVISRDGHKLLTQLLYGMKTRLDYTKGFEIRRSIYSYVSDMRYMLLLRGALGVELVLGKTMLPRELRNVDMADVDWYEDKLGQYKPVQSPANSNEEIDLDIPTFFTSWFRRDPTRIYAYSPFVSAVNSIAARQQVINDLYRIMQYTGYPRLHVSVVEEVLMKNMPASIKGDVEKQSQWLNTRLGEISTTVATMRPDQAFIHWDSIEPGMINDTKPGLALNIDSIINTLNAQNQAALKVMATVIGRGDKNGMVSSTETRIFALNAEQLNEPIAEILTQIFTMLVRLHGFDGYVDVEFERVELRPELELEPQKVMKQSRLLDALSYGLITDDEFHLEMFGRIRPDEAPELSGTNFRTPVQVGVDAEEVTPNADPLGRSLSSKSSKSAKSNTVK